jgi:NAD(P)-dependent dehydrogenase (short-subunit alcohol dehydrogenase family)
MPTDAVTTTSEPCYQRRMSRRFAGRACLITGASGIAAAAARRFAREGAALHVVSLDADECRALGTEISAAGGACTWTAGDLREEQAVATAVERALALTGRLDALFAVAGASGRRFGDGPAHEIPLSGWEATLGLNLTPGFLALRDSVRVMRDQRVDDDGLRGAVVLVGSALATSPSPALFATHAYAAAKGALEALTRTTAAYYASDGIRVNTVAPGLVATPMSRRAAGDARTVAYVEGKQPLARGLLEPEDVSDAALFLLSAEARRITGQVLAVDGGWHIAEGVR